MSPAPRSSEDPPAQAAVATTIAITATTTAPVTPASPAQRISPSDDFTSVHAIAELNTGTENGDPGLTLDESEIVFASTRGGNYDVYIASRPCL